MPVVSSATSVTLSLPAGSAIKFDYGGEGVAAVGFSPQPMAIRGGDQIGPFGTTTVVSISAARALTYSIRPTALGVFAENGIAVEADGTLVKAVASDLIEAVGSMTLAGDSLANLCWGTGTEANQGVVSRAWYEWANTSLRTAGIDLECRSNLGVGSKTIAQVVAEQFPTAFASGNDILWTNFGINDLNSTLGNTPTNTIISLLRSAVSSVYNNVKVGVFNSINPISQGGTSGARPRANEIPIINAAFESICSEYPTITFLNTYGALIDPTSAALNPIANSMQVDGIHPTSFGAKLMSAAAVATFPRRLKITPLYAKGANLLPAISSGSGGTTTPGTGTISGTVPAGWNVAVAAGSASVVCSYVSPDSFRLVITNAGAASTVRVQLADGAAFASNFTLSDRIAFEAVLKTQGAVLLNRLNTSFSFNGATNWFGLGQASDETNFTYPQAAFAGRYKTRPYLLSALGSLTSVLPIISINVGATTGAVTLDIANPQVYKTT